MNFFKKAAAIAVAAGLALSVSTFGVCAEKSASKGIAIIHTNDVHCRINADDDTFGYADVAAYRAKLESEGYKTLLVDAGDYTQGDVIGSLSNGEYLIDIMNNVGYDAAALGNHEFDYGIKQLKKNVKKAKFDVLCSNFVSLETGESLFDGYTVKDVGGTKIGIVGVVTPKTVSSSDPANFTDKNGNYIYGFCPEEEAFYANVQASVDGAKAAGAEYVIVLSHLGVIEAETTYTSYQLIGNTSGIDAVIDAHSHSVNNEKAKNKDGKNVVLVSTGTRLQNIGTLIIENGNISAKPAAKGSYTVSEDENSAEYKAYAKASGYIKSVEEKYTELVNTVVAKTDVALVAENPENESDRIVRYRETNLGDFCADAYREVLNADVGIVNGGGIRKNIPAGDITYGDIIAIHPFGNEMCVAVATGQEILDALEVGVMKSPDLSGAFLQVSGIEFEVHNYIPSSVVFDENERFVKVDGEYRVKNVKINGKPIDLNKQYTVASHNFIIKSGGSGLSMFMDNELIMDGAMLDNQVLIEYMTENLGGVVGDEYSDIYGSGRINIAAEASAAPETAQTDIPATGNSAAGEIAVMTVSLVFICASRKKNRG